MKTTINGLGYEPAVLPEPKLKPTAEPKTDPAAAQTDEQYSGEYCYVLRRKERILQPRRD